MKTTRTRNLLASALACAEAFTTFGAQAADPATSAEVKAEPAALEASTASSSGGDASDLAKQLSNPVAALISVPFQFNYDGNIGPEDDGERFFLNTQPVIPVSISQDWNMISRTIVPLIYQNDLAPGLGDQFGLGDIVGSLFSRRRRRQKASSGASGPSCCFRRRRTTCSAAESGARDRPPSR